MYNIHSLRQFFEYLLQEDASYNRIGHDLGIVVQKVEVVPPVVAAPSVEIQVEAFADRSRAGDSGSAVNQKRH